MGDCDVCMGWMDAKSEVKLTWFSVFGPVLLVVDFVDIIDTQPVLVPGVGVLVTCHLGWCLGHGVGA